MKQNLYKDFQQTFLAWFFSKNGTKHDDDDDDDDDDELFLWYGWPAKGV